MSPAFQDTRIAGRNSRRFKTRSEKSHNYIRPRCEAHRKLGEGVNIQGTHLCFNAVTQTMDRDDGFVNHVAKNSRLVPKAWKTFSFKEPQRIGCVNCFEESPFVVLAATQRFPLDLQGNRCSPEPNPQYQVSFYPPIEVSRLPKRRKERAGKKERDHPLGLGGLAVTWFQWVDYFPFGKSGVALTSRICAVCRIVWPERYKSH